VEKFRNPDGQLKENLLHTLYNTNFISKSFGGSLQNYVDRTQCINLVTTFSWPLTRDTRNYQLLIICHPRSNDIKHKHGYIYLCIFAGNSTWFKIFKIRIPKTVVHKYFANRPFIFSGLCKISKFPKIPINFKFSKK
jgi:hypothetical protein